MGKVTGTLLFSLVLSTMSLVMQERAHACQVTAPIPSVDELKRVPARGYAFSGVVRDVLWNGKERPPGIPHQGFVLKVYVLQSFAKPIFGVVSVAYGMCEFATAPGERINVIAEMREQELIAVHYANYFLQKVR